MYTWAGLHPGWSGGIDFLVLPLLSPPFVKSPNPTSVPPAPLHSLLSSFPRRRLRQPPPIFLPATLPTPSSPGAVKPPRRRTTTRATPPQYRHPSHHADEQLHVLNLPPPPEQVEALHDSLPRIVGNERCSAVGCII